MRNICIKNLPLNFDESRLSHLCSRYGDVSKCAIMRNKKGVSRGIAMVAFDSEEHASLALSSLDGCYMCLTGDIITSPPVCVDGENASESSAPNALPLGDKSTHCLIAVPALKDPLNEDELQCRAAKVKEQKERNKLENRDNQANHQEIRKQRLQVRDSFRASIRFLHRAPLPNRRRRRTSSPRKCRKTSATVS